MEFVSCCIAGGGGGGGPVIVPVSGTTPVSAGAGCNFTVLTSPQILSMDVAPITMLTTPGANKVITPTALLIQAQPGTLQYLPEPSGVWGWFYNTPAAANLIQSYDEVAKPLLSNTPSTPLDIFVPFLASSVAPWTASPIVTTPVVPTVIANQPVVIGANGSNNNTFNAGPITTVTIAAPGAGYAVNDTFTIDAGILLADTGDATGHVTSTGGGGSVTGVALNNHGTSYAITTANTNTGPYPTAHTSGAGNNALTLNVTGATVGNGTGVVFIWYNVATLQ